jgi:PAS domain S-box-containing protein
VTGKRTSAGGRPEDSGAGGGPYEEEALRSLRSGEADAFVIVGHDSEARVLVLEGADESYRQVVETMSGGVLVADGDGRLVYTNPALRKLVPGAAHQLTGCGFETLFAARDQARLKSCVRDWLDRAGTADGHLAGRSGENVAVTLSGSPLRSESFRGVLVILHDVSRRTALEARLRELLERMTLAQEEERQRIAADIHDDTIQVLAAVSTRMQRLRTRLADDLQLRLLADVEETMRLATGRLRSLVFDLRPPALDVNGGLPDAIRQYLETTRAETHLQFEVRGHAVPDMPAEKQLILYRVTQEALINVGKHARALRVDVEVEEVDQGVRVRVRDDGAGFETSGAGSVAGHLGITAMRERAELAGGWWRCESAAGQGSLVEFWVPL